jgi:hypothetical protein
MQSTISDSPSFVAERAFLQASGKWGGCDWPVQFGKLGLNLRGLESRHADLMARATSGEESTEWRRAAKWLARIEQDARQAEDYARAAVELTDKQLDEAVRSAEQACYLEAKYHDHLVWQPLRDLLDRLWHESPREDGQLPGLDGTSRL